MKMIIRRFLVVVLVLTLVGSQLISIATAEESKLFYPKLTNELTYDPDGFDYDMKTIFAITLVIDAANAGYLTLDDLAQLIINSSFYVGGDNKKVAIGIATESNLIVLLYNVQNNKSTRQSAGAYLEFCESGIGKGSYSLVIASVLNTVVGNYEYVDSSDIIEYGKSYGVCD